MVSLHPHFPHAPTGNGALAIFSLSCISLAFIDSGGQNIITLLDSPFYSDLQCCVSDLNRLYHIFDVFHANPHHHISVLASSCGMLWWPGGPPHSPLCLTVRQSLVRRHPIVEARLPVFTGKRVTSSVINGVATASLAVATSRNISAKRFLVRLV